MTDLANQLDVVDNKPFRLADLDTNIRASTSGLESSSQNIASVSRSEFIEIMLRIAIDKYLKTGICESEYEALKKLIDDHIEPNLGHFDSDKWRYERYFNEENDLILSGNQENLQKVFAKYSGKSAKYGDKPWMSLEEFTNCCKDANLTSKSFGQRQYTLCYQLSLMTHKDIVLSKRQSQMRFDEFLEAIARVADFIDFAEVEKTILKGSWSEEPLDGKLEALMVDVNRLLRSDQPRKKLPVRKLIPSPE